MRTEAYFTEVQRKTIEATNAQVQARVLAEQVTALKAEIEALKKAAPTNGGTSEAGPPPPAK